MKTTHNIRYKPLLRFRSLISKPFFIRRQKKNFLAFLVVLIFFVYFYRMKLLIKNNATDS